MVTEDSRDKIDKICKKKGEGMRAVQSDDAASDYKNGKMLDRSIIWVDGRLKKNYYSNLGQISEATSKAAVIPHLTV